MIHSAIIIACVVSAPVAPILIEVTQGFGLGLAPLYQVWVATVLEVGAGIVKEVVCRQRCGLFVVERET